MESVYRASGRWHFYSGEIVHGTQRGRKLLGYPTINLNISPKLYALRRGVYVTHTLIDGKVLRSVTNVGHNPTFKDKPFTVETYILDFDEMLYDRHVTIQFLHFLREEMTFADVSALTRQIQEDVSRTRQYFASY